MILSIIDLTNNNSINIDDILFIDYYGHTVVNKHRLLFCFKKGKSRSLIRKYIAGVLKLEEDHILYEAIFVSHKASQKQKIKEYLPSYWLDNKPDRIDCKKVKKLLLLS